MREFMKNLNYSLIALFLLLTRVLIKGATFQDAVILFSFSLLYLGHFFIKEFFRVKELVISENNFRKVVNEDIAILKNSVSNISLAVKGNPFSGNKR